MTNTVSQEVEKRERGPEQLVDTYKQDFAVILPAHVKPDSFVRLAQYAVRRNPALAAAAQRNPGSFISALLDCARLGMQPGETFHLVPFGNDIVGIIDWTGEVELIYNAGAVSSVKAEIVYSNDVFIYNPSMDRPDHQVDWFGNRGEMIGVYAYAVMKDGATSRVVVMSKTDVDRVKAVSKTSKSSSSPWNQWPDRMWLKTAVKQLAKWVPSSAEARAVQQQAAAAVAAVHEAKPELPAPTRDVIDAEVVAENGNGHSADDPWSAAQPGGSDPDPDAAYKETLEGELL